MTERRSEFGYEDLLACGRGELFGAGNAQLPLPPMLMFERIPLISKDGGANGKGQVTAEMAINGNPQVEWFFGCHFPGDSVRIEVQGATVLPAADGCNHHHIARLGERIREAQGLRCDRSGRRQIRSLQKCPIQSK